MSTTKAWHCPVCGQSGTVTPPSLPRSNDRLIQDNHIAQWALALNRQMVELHRAVSPECPVNEKGHVLQLV